MQYLKHSANMILTDSIYCDLFVTRMEIGLKLLLFIIWR